MDSFRATFIVLFLCLATLRGYYRFKGRGHIKERVRETWTMVTAFFVGLPFVSGVWLYLLDPRILRTTTLSIAGAWRWFGALLFAGSLVLLASVHVSLDKNFSSALRVRSDQQLVTRGPYAYVRHPMYSAIFLLIPGMALLSANWMIGASGLAVIALVVSLRTAKEEQMMMRAFGDRYRQYAARTPRFVPHFGVPFRKSERTSAR